MAAVGMCDQCDDLLPALGDVEHVNQLSDNIGALFMHDSYSDITLVVDGQNFVAHKVVLAARSEYFRLVALSELLLGTTVPCHIRRTTLNV